MTTIIDGNDTELKPSFKHLEKHHHYGLSHDYGNGAPCLNCSNCSGLDLHYWRKVCKDCGCRIDSHDIPSIEHKDCDIVVCSLFGGIHNHFNQHQHQGQPSSSNRKVMNNYDSEILRDASKYWSTSEDASPAVSSSRSDSSSTISTSTTDTSRMYINELNSISDTLKRTSIDSRTHLLNDTFRRDSESTINSSDSVSNPRSMNYSVSINNNKVIDHSDSKETQTNDEILMKEWNQSDEAKNNYREFVENAKRNHFGVAKSIQCNENEFETSFPPNTSKIHQNTTGSVTNIHEISVQRNPRRKEIQETYHHYEEKKVKRHDPCKRCGERLEHGESGIYASHGGSIFHKDCFRCQKCENLLEDLLYFFKNDKYLCGRHYGDENYPRCGGCDELIFTREYTEADGESWHKEHFCCSHCDIPLGGMKYVHIEGKQYCFQCHSIVFKEICNTCKNVILPDESRLKHKGFIWHNKLECFRCSQCDEVLVNRKFVFKEGKTFCSFQCKQRFESFI